MIEIFKDIEEYKGLYKISNMGNVKALGNDRARKEKILKPAKNKSGYLTVCLCKEGKQTHFLIHRLVAQAFLSNTDNLPQVNHRDEDKTNNCVSNLEWCDHKYNINYGSHNKRVAETNTNHPNKSKQVMCLETGVVYPSTNEIQRELGFSRGNISSVCNGKRKSCGGYTWKYVI